MVVSVHRRRLASQPATIGELIDRLGSGDDPLWPRRDWPPMRLDRGLQAGSSGAHGPIRYVVAWYEPGRGVWFRFTAPRGFRGGHGFFAHDAAGGTLLEHRLEMSISGSARIAWPFLYRPLHDALIEDALWRAARAVGEDGEAPSWSRRVRFLRWAFGALRRRREPG